MVARFVSGLVGLLLAGCSLTVEMSMSGVWQGLEDYPAGYTDYHTRLEVIDSQGVLSGNSYNCTADFSQCAFNGPITGTRQGTQVQLQYAFDARNSTAMVLHYAQGGWQGQTYTPFRDKTIQEGSVRLERADQDASATRRATTELYQPKVLITR